MQKNKLKTILTRLCITQADFAKAVGVSEAQMCRMCNAEKVSRYHKFLISEAAKDNAQAASVTLWLNERGLPDQEKTEKQKHYDLTVEAMQTGERVYFRAPYELPYLKKICKHNFTIKPRVDGVWVAKVK